jgi:hypothetical protein
MIQLLLHLLGDYILQSHWAATEKTKHWRPAFYHAIFYSLPFLLIGSPSAVLAIAISHYLIDRYRLVRYVVWSKNIVLGHWIKWSSYFSDNLWGNYHYPEREELKEDRHLYSWQNCRKAGYPEEVPSAIAFTLMVAADNTIHLCLNYWFLTWK